MVVDRFGLATFACLFNKDFSKVLMIKRNDEKKKKYGFDWGIIGGKIEFEEYSKDAVIREIKEEIGIEIQKDDLKFLYMKEVPNWFNVSHVVFFIYGARIDEKTKIILNDESEGYQWFDVKNLPESKSSDDDILEILRVTKEKFESEDIY